MPYDMGPPRPPGLGHAHPFQEPRIGSFNVTDLKSGRCHSWSTAISPGYQHRHVPANHGWVETVPAPPPFAPPRAGKLVYQKSTSGRGSHAVSAYVQDRGKPPVDHTQRHMEVTHMSRGSKSANGLQHGKVHALHHAGMNGLCIHEGAPGTSASQVEEGLREAPWTDLKRQMSGP